MDEMDFNISGQLVDVVSGKIEPAGIRVEKGRIAAIQKTSKAESHYLIPGLVDAHVHIESSMLVPSEFARLAVVHGTAATVSDPHEIANVVGLRGVEYMLENAARVPFHFYFGAPSCVPATRFETAGASLGVAEVEELLKRDEIRYLSEMMNFPGVLNGDREVMEKIALAKKYGKPIDGHAPGLRGADLARYAAAGISTDHECFTKEEALDKIRAGMKIIIREGSAARNFDALIGLIAEYPDRIMFCSDDKHPDSLLKGHINDLVRRAIKHDFDPIAVLRAATLNPVRHYKLNNGLLQQGDSADFIVVNNLEDFEVEQVFIKGIKVASRGQSLIPETHASFINRFDAAYINVEDIEVPVLGNTMRVIEALDGQLVTRELLTAPNIVNEKVCSDTERDLLKLVVVNRYAIAPPAVAFVKNFGLKNGAIASSVAHDSHNIIAVGSDDNSIKRAVNLIIQNMGGISFVNEDDHPLILPLPVAGLMHTQDGYKTAAQYEELDEAAKNAGSTLSAPYMTLSFLALLVIPELKLSDKGLFNGNEFRFTNLFV